MPVLIREDFSLGVGFDTGLLGQAQAMADIDILEFILASRQGLVQGDRLGVAESVIDPVSALHHFHCFFGGCKFPLVLFCVRHHLPPIFFSMPPDRVARWPGRPRSLHGPPSGSVLIPFLRLRRLILGTRTAITSAVEKAILKTIARAVPAAPDVSQSNVAAGVASIITNNPLP